MDHFWRDTVYKWAHFVWLDVSHHLEVQGTRHPGRSRDHLRPEVEEKVGRIQDAQIQRCRIYQKATLYLEQIFFFNKKLVVYPLGN